MKLSLFQSQLKKKKIALAYLSYPDPSLTYLIQSPVSGGFLLVSPNGSTFYLSKLDLNFTKDNIKILPLDKKTFSSLKSDQVRRIGINKQALTLQEKDRLSKIYPRAKFIDISALLQKLRIRKTPEEIKLIKHASELTVSAFRALLPKLSSHQLKTEQDIVIFIENYFRRHGAEPAFPTIAANGPNSAIPHHCSSLRRLSKGPLLLDFGARYQNYCSDFSRTIFLGSPTLEQEEIYSVLRKAQEKTILQVHKNLSFPDLDKSARKNLGSYSSYFIHSLGHGLGIEIHESPRYEKGSNIQEGMVFTIEPGLYFPNKFGFRIEDTVLFSKNSIILTKASKKLIIIKGY
jgi:Xaa-Pro dipeptidase